jgi:tetratricopeptide (TPR) repeat protein
LKEEKALNERLAKNVEDEEALSALARIALVKGNLLEAQGLADKALAVNPKNTEALITMGDLFYHESKRRYSTAIEYYNKALAAGADDFGTHFKLGLSYMKSDQTEKAIKEFNEAKRCFPSYIKYEDNPYYYLATIYENAGDTAKMAKELADYVKIAYEDFTTQMKVADIYWKENKFDELIKVMENTVYLDPKDIALHARLGLAYWEKKDYAKALREYQVAIFLINQLEENYSVNQKCSVFYAHMAEIYFESGDKEKAMAYIVLALKKDQDNERAANLKKKMQD